MSAGKALIFTSNRAHTEDEDYFEKLAVAMDLFTHTWSLSVEIQFYFIIPFIFLIGLQLKGASRYIYYACLSGLSFIFHATSPTSVAFNKLTPLPVRLFITIFTGNTWILTSALIISILLAMLVHQTYERWYLRQSNNMIATLVIILFSSNAIFIYRDQIQENVDRTMNNTVSSDGKYPRFDGWTPNMTLDDAQKMNYHWNRYDINDPKLRESGCVHKFPNKNWCEYPGNGTEYKIAILGSSYARNHYKLIIQECRNRAKAFTTADVMGCEPIAAPHIPVDNGRAFAKTWSPTCANHLIMFVDFINTTQPDYAFIMSRFFAVAEPYNNGPDNLNNDTVYLEMKSQLKKMLPNIKKKLFILDSFPRIQTKEVAKIAEEMKKGNKKMEDINKSLYDPFHYERGRHRYAELVKNECGPKCELIDYVDAFWNKTMNAFQYFDSNGFTYFTSINHVSAHGLEHVRPIYNKICSGL
ncbi:hypothetical protein L3Y34_003717 [Caenorhabditis briggsae]|uniref:SGNH domain-containing protein n=1 Tax=Caenorhabditis briggsae TaxID=6238 RepID=A0AAE9D5F3_CAEBR|nr:hypothetical protein L3Y34_003717 [Caenorhabditis briggsae]